MGPFSQRYASFIQSPSTTSMPRDNDRDLEATTGPSCPQQSARREPHLRPFLPIQGDALLREHDDSARPLSGHRKVLVQQPRNLIHFCCSLVPVWVTDGTTEQSVRFWLRKCFTMIVPFFILAFCNTHIVCHLRSRKRKADAEKAQQSANGGKRKSIKATRSG